MRHAMIGRYSGRVLRGGGGRYRGRAERRLRVGLRVVEASALVCAAAVAQRWVPVARWSRVLGEAGPVPAQWSGQAIESIPTAAGSPSEHDVAVAIHRACWVLPFQPTCLAQAGAGQLMLRRRGEPGVVVVGLRAPETADGEDAAVSDGWGAHAWLMGCAGALTGGSDAAGFTAATVYRVRSGREAEQGVLHRRASGPAGYEAGSLSGPWTCNGGRSMAVGGPGRSRDQPSRQFSRFRRRRG